MFERLANLRRSVEGCERSLVALALMGLFTALMIAGWQAASLMVLAVAVVFVLVAPLCGFVGRRWGEGLAMVPMAAGLGTRQGRTPSSVRRGGWRSAERAGVKRSYVEQLIAEGRYALLLRPEVAGTLTSAERELAAAELRRQMAWMPAGRVLLKTRVAGGDAELAAERRLDVDGFWIDRFPVTNAQYRCFVEAGGYEDASLWDAPAVLWLPSFVDATGVPGPRFWSEGTYPVGQDDFPVVGVSWYEAAAYARWTGKRLPSDPEWVRAAAWPVEVAGKLVQRRYPWGQTFDRRMANIWSSGKEGVVAVTEFGGGATPAGVCQMIGNVWEWMADDLGAWDDPHDRLETDEPMKSLRGGAFDTYFESQATCQFQSGDSLLARRRNIGFRCVIGGADLVEDAETGKASTEEPQG